MGPIPIAFVKRKHLLLVAASAFIAGMLYLATAMFAGVGAVTSAWYQAGPACVVGALMLTLLNVTLRCLRWHVFLRVLGHDLPFSVNFPIYLAGLSLTTVPGKLGEMIRSFFLYEHGVPYSKEHCRVLRRSPVGSDGRAYGRGIPVMVRLRSYPISQRLCHWACNRGGCLSGRLSAAGRTHTSHRAPVVACGEETLGPRVDVRAPPCLPVAACLRHSACSSPSSHIRRKRSPWCSSSRRLPPTFSPRPYS